MQIGGQMAVNKCLKAHDLFFLDKTFGVDMIIETESTAVATNILKVLTGRGLMHAIL